MDKRTKTFFVSMPFQGKDKDGNDMLKPVLYESLGSDRLGYGETRFPIIPVIANYTTADDSVKIVAIITEGDSFQHNFDAYFVPEVTTLSEKIGFQFEGIDVIRTPDSEDISVQLALFGDIIDKVRDNDELYACITYGTKPTPIILSMAMNYAYRLKENTTVECIVYGRYDHVAKSGRIFDTTALFYMDSIVNRLAELKTENPTDTIKALLNIED